MRLAVDTGKRIYFASVVEMRTLCGLKRGKPANEWAQLLLWPLLWRISFLREPPFPMMTVLFLLSTVSIQNQRENFGTIWIITFRDLLQLLIYMRELGRMSFLRETTRTSLLRELQYHLLLILGVGLVVRPASILHQNGFEGTMGNWNV
jgi:hypothetical protein